MIHSWIQAVLAKGKQPSMGHTFQNELSLGPIDDGMKRLAYLQRHFAIDISDKAVNNLCIMCNKHFLRLYLNEV